ncbi:MAG: hypothetical protein ABIJ52_13265 [Pseudomonadota bacterium]
MPERTDSEKRHIESIQKVQVQAYFAVFTVFAISLVIEKDAFVSMWDILNAPNMIPAICRIFLFLTIVSLVCRWIAATAHELNLWLDWVEFVFIKSQVYIAMFSLSIALGLMLVLVYNLTTFTAYFTIYLLLNYWTQWLSNEHFQRAIKKTEKTINNEAVLSILETYWLRRPQLGRIATMMFFSSIAFIFSLVYELKYKPHDQLFLTLSYIIIIGTILTGEIFISCWRYKRDKDLQKIIP